MHLCIYLIGGHVSEMSRSQSDGSNKTSNFSFSSSTAEEEDVSKRITINDRKGGGLKN